MNTTIRTILIILAVVIFGSALFFAGAYFGGTRYAYTPYGMMGGYGSSGMMSGMMNGGMMGGPGIGGSGSAQPISVEDARASVESYLGALGNDDLAIKEIMIFDNGAYASVEEESTGIGAFELLVDPASLSVSSEYGPNMMWNVKYAGLNHRQMMGGRGGYSMMRGMMGAAGGMMDGWEFQSTPSAKVSAEMTVTPEDAVRYAQVYLDQYDAGAVAADDPIQFYGYYTLDFSKDGKIAGMLSVNGYTGQVWLHTWHGSFVEESGE